MFSRYDFMGRHSKSSYMRYNTSATKSNPKTIMGGMREHEGQPVIEAGASVYRLGTRCRTQAQMHDL
jgi:hypothetical protein